METIEDKIRDFVFKVRFWLAEQGQKISDLEDRGGETQSEWNQIMMFVEECEWVLVTIYDPTYMILQEDGLSAAFNFLNDWTDEEIEQYMSYWKTRWGVGESAAISIALESITLIDGGINGGSGINLPPGGQVGDRLINIGNNQLAWETPATVFDMGTTT